MIVRTALAFTFLLIGLPALAGNVNLLPMLPTAGSELTIEYKPDHAEMGWATKDAHIHAVAMWFAAESQAPIAVDVPLRYDGKRFTGTYTVPAMAVYVMFKVGTGNEYDNNGELYWSTLIYDEKGRDLSGANLRASQACLGMLPPECRRKQDVEEAIDLLLQETKVSPRLLTPRINLVMVEFSSGKYSKEEGIARLRQLVSTTTVPTSAEEAMSIASAFRLIGDSIEATRVMREAAMKFPNSLVSEQVRLEKLGQATTFDDFVNLVIDHLHDFPNSVARPNLIEAVLTQSTKQNAFPTLIRFLNSVPHLPAIVYSQAVNYLGMQDSLRMETMKLIEKGLANATDPEARLSYVGEAEWTAQQEISRSQLYFVKGAILQHDGKTAEAVDALKSSVKYGGIYTDKSVFEMLVTALDPVRQTDEVISYSEQAISSGTYTAAVVERYKVALAQRGASEKEINEAITKQKAEGSSKLANRLKHEMLNMPMIDGEFVTLEGAPVKISDWQGKVVIIDYWATWCGPCRKSFPSLQKLYEKYKNNPKVVFAIVNVWERTDDRATTVRDFLSKNPALTFPMYMDKTDAVVQKYGVTGIPTKFFLGKDGRIQFKEVGLAPDEQFIEESSQKIDLLLSE